MSGTVVVQYGPAGFTPEYANDIPQGGQEASGLEQLAQVERDQIKHGADTPLTIGDLRNDPVSFATLPKLDVAGSSPVARSISD